MDKRTEFEKALGSIAYNYGGTALRAQLWMLCGLSHAIAAYVGGYELSSIGLIYIFVMMFTFGHFFSYLPTHLRKYGFNVKGRPRLWWVILERTLFPLFFLIYCDNIKMRFEKRYNIGQQWMNTSKASLRKEQQQECEKFRDRILNLKEWYLKRRRRQDSQHFIKSVQAIGQHMRELDPYYHWDRDPSEIREVFDRYQHALPSHKENIEHYYRQSLTPINDGKKLPEVNLKQPTLEGKLLYLAAVIRAEKDNYYNRLDFTRSDFNAGRYVYTSNRSAIDITYWSRNLPAINAYLGGEWVVEPLDGTSLVLYQLAELPPLIPFQTAFLQKDRIFYGFNVRTGEPVYNSLDKIPHHLVVGQSGSGKSVFIKQALASFLHNIDHFESLYLIDLKGGVELGQFENLHPKIKLIDDYDDLPSTVEAIYKAMRARLKEMKQTGESLYSGKHIGIIVDEHAQIAQYVPVTPEEKKQHQLLISYLNRISMLGRAARLFLWTQLQKATTDNIHASYRSNHQTKICFKVHSNSEAAVVFGSTDELPGVTSIGGFSNLAKGRYILNDDVIGDAFYMQAALMDDGFPLARLVKTSKTARAGGEEQDGECARPSERSEGG